MTTDGSFPTIEICIPVLDEIESLSAQIHKLLSEISLGEKVPSCCTVVIADNGSTDGTLELAQELAKNDTRIRVISTGQRGVGGALQKAWASAQADLIGYMDLDFSTDLSHLREVYEFLRYGEYDFVTATRWSSQSKVVGRSALRTVTSWAFNALIRKYIGVQISDGMCGFKFFRRDRLDEYMSHSTRNTGWFFSTELCVIAKMCGDKYLELPVLWIDDRKSKVKVISLSMSYLIAMHRFRNDLRTRDKHEKM